MPHRLLLTVLGILTVPTALAADPLFKAVEPFGCDLSQWSADPQGTQSPIPNCYGSRLSSKIDIAYPGVVGIGAEDGSRVPTNDPTFLQHGQLLIQSKTTKGNDQQESAIVSNMITRTGGSGASQTNHNQKVNLTLFTLMMPGASNTWGMNNDFHINPGVGHYPAFRHEGDMTNFNGDYAPGGCNPCAKDRINANAAGDFLTFTGYPITAGIWLTGEPNSGNANMHYGLYFAGNPKHGSVGTGLIKAVTVYDATNAPTSLKIDGTHTTGIDTSGASMSYAATFGSGQKLCFGGTSGCLNYDNVNRLLNYNNGQILLSDTGSLTVSGAIREVKSYTVPHANAPCSVGQHSWDANFEYRCVATNQWKRIPYLKGSW